MRLGWRPVRFIAAQRSAAPLTLSGCWLLCSTVLLSKLEKHKKTCPAYQLMLQHKARRHGGQRWGCYLRFVGQPFRMQTPAQRP